MAEIDTIGLYVILALGNFAAQTLLATKEGITRLRGRRISTGRAGPCHLPSAFLLRNPGPEFRDGRA